VDLVGGTNLDRGKGRRMEHGYDGMCESGRGTRRGRVAGMRAGLHDVTGGGAAEGGVRPGA